MIQLGKLLNIKEGEGKPTTLLFAYSFFFGATLTVGKTARDTYFLNRFDIAYLPLMFLVAASAVTIIAIINYLASKRLDLIHNLFRTIYLSGLIFAISLILIQTHLKGLFIPFLYVWIDVITMVINFQFIIYASMVFNSRQAKRLFGIILCGSAIARIVIGASILPFVGQFGSDYLLTLTAGFVLCCVLIAWIARPYIHHEPKAQQIQHEEASKNIGFLDSYLKMLALAIGAAAVATVIIEYQFLIFSNHAFPSEERLARFFGTFYSVTGFVSLFTQFLLTRWILARFGILSAIRILPFGLGIGSLAILFNPSLLSALIARVSDQIAKFTLNKTSFDLLWVPVSPDQKQRKKLFIDDTIKTSMQGLTGIFIYALTKMWPLPYLSLMQVLSLVALVFIGIWFLTTSHLKNGYVSALVSAIEKRQLDFEQMPLDTTDSHIVKTIEDALNSDEEAKQVFALELISGLYLTPWSDTLSRLFKKGSPSVQAKILAMTADYPDIVSDAEVRITIEEQGLLARDALIISGKRNMREMIPTLRHILENTRDKDAEICAAAATAVLMMNKGPCDLAQSTLEELLHNENENLKAIALRMLHHIPDFLTDTQLRDCCVSDSIDVCSAVLDIAHLRHHVSMIPCIINCLKHPQTRSVARNVLEMYPPGDVVDILNKTLIQDEIDTDLKIEIVRTLKDYPDYLSISILVRMLKHPSLHIQAESIDALLKIARQTPLSAGILQQLSGESQIIARHIYTRYQVMGLMVRGSEGLLLYDLCASDIEKRIPMLIKLLVLPVPEIPVETYITYDKYEYEAQAENLIEIFDNILPRRESGYVIPLLQDISIEDRCRAGQRYFTDLPNELDMELIKLIQSPNEYHRIIGLDYAICQCRMKVLEQIDWAIFTDQGIYYEIIAQYVIKNNDALMNLPQFPQQRFQKPVKELQMLSILEKTIILRSTNLFEGVPGENIYHVAQVMEEKRLEKGILLFERGDKGDYFYIIVTGEILIHIGETELNRHGKGEYFGEMALLDDCPRSASATALEETLLLKINQDNFLDIMMDHKEVRRSILRMLNERSRRLTDQYARAMP
jgi:AAA family ATP:ADP antiporter